MNSVSLTGSLSRRAGGLFESVRRLHQELMGSDEAPASTTSKSSTNTRKGIHVRVLGLRDELTDLDLNAWQPVPVRTFKTFGPCAFGYAPGLLAAMNHYCPDLVHVHGLWQYRSIATTTWSGRSRRPYIVSPHGMLDSWALNHSAWKKKLAWLLYERRHLSGAACIRALCASELASIRALGLRNPVCIVPNGIDLVDLTSSRETQVDVETAGRRASAKILLYLGRIHPKKGLALLLRAWANQPKRNDWVLVIAGWDQGGHEAQLKHLAQQLGLDWSDNMCAHDSASVQFIGPQFGRDKDKWLRRCHAVVLPSLSEGLPVAILEAWTRAKPALLTPQCNLSVGSTAGAAIEVEPNVEAIGAGLQRLFRSDAEELKTMGWRGRTLAAGKFAWPKIADDLRAVYGWIANGGSMPSCVFPA